ncbi:MAG: hypothetical protein HQK84_04230 [Nitrospinae bacterium]|nr:hypothetical protein [Nitrospinota bacterium]
MKYSTAIRPWANRRLEKMGKVDIVVGIPTNNNHETIENIIDNVSEAVQMHYRGMTALIIVADGGSTDDTRDVANAKTVNPYIEKMVTIYRGERGKSSAYKMIFESANFLNSRVCVIVDPASLSITTDWIKHLIDPVLIASYHYVTPLYSHNDNDVGLSDSIAFYLTSALMSKQVKTPTGGDYALSGQLLSFIVENNIWDNQTSSYGIDVWILLKAITEKFKICQSYLGLKEVLSNDRYVFFEKNFVETVTTVFEIAVKHKEALLSFQESEPTEIYNSPVEYHGEIKQSICYKECIILFKQGYAHFSPIWENILDKENYEEVKKAFQLNDENFIFEPRLLAKIIYSFARQYSSMDRYKNKVIQCLVPIYYAYLASLIKRTERCNTKQLEEEIRKDAEPFQELRLTMFA